MTSQSAEDTAHYRALVPMARCEFVKMNLTIIIIQRITHAFDCAYVVHLTNQMFVGCIQMQMFKVHIQMQVHLQFYGGI